MAAPAGGFGAYTSQQIETIFLTAYTAFAAAVHESTRDPHQSRQTLIHTGFWGCGAFGGNRHLMIALQSLAARAAKVHHLILHTADPTGVEAARKALQTAENVAESCGPTCTLQQLAQAVAKLGLRWGMSDGN